MKNNIVFLKKEKVIFKKDCFLNFQIQGMYIFIVEILVLKMPYF